jgi:NTP pyrophosphatase (non-canonical NTP hydrolase)
MNMGYMTDGLTFRVLRDANVVRLPLFKTKDGKPAHTVPDGSDWPPASWLQAVVGELGEYANDRKKVERGDITLEEARPKLAQELADVAIYLDLLAYQLDIDLGQAIMETWNRKSEFLGIPVRIDPDDWHYTRELTVEEAELVSRTRTRRLTAGGGR